MPPALVMQLLLCIWGEIKTAKSSIGLTFPKPLMHFDFDMGFHRAEPRVSHLKILKVPWDQPLSNVIPQVAPDNPPDIITKPYPKPIKFPGQKVFGMLDLWENHIVPDVMSVCAAPWIVSVNFDTGSVMTEVAQAAHLERAQQREPGRTQLTQIEFGKPNGELRALYDAMKTYGKNLASVHHVGGVYQESFVPHGNSVKKESVRIGDTWQGFTGTGKAVDVIGRMEIIRGAVNGSKPTPQMTIVTCGLTLTAEGIPLLNPTYEGILSLINGLRGSQV